MDLNLLPWGVTLSALRPFSSRCPALLSRLQLRFGGGSTRLRFKKTHSGVNLPKAGYFGGTGRAATDLCTVCSVRGC